MSEHEQQEIILEEILAMAKGKNPYDPSQIVVDPDVSLKMSASIADQVSVLDATVQKFNDELDALAIPHRVDEVAMVFADPFQLLSWVSMAVRLDGWEHFGAALDEVIVAGPIHGHYTAHYEFVRILDRPYRIEGMSVPHGHSPLHAAALHSTGGIGMFVHSSFKCDDLFEYQVVVRHISEAGTWLAAQICQSSYGEFTYFAPSTRLQEEHELPTMMLKPRVNLRDVR